MSVRCCGYKDCDNISIGNVANGNFTLFQFPKDPLRRKQWIDLGQVDPKLCPGTLLMCSDHFDRSKYLSINPRRTILVGAAVPYAYGNQVEEIDNEIVDTVSTNQVVEVDEESASYLYTEGANDQQQEKTEEEELRVESTIDDYKDETILTYQEMMGSSEENSMDEEQEHEVDYVVEPVEPSNSNVQTSANQVLTIGSSNNFKLTGDIRPRNAIEEETKSKTVNVRETTTTPNKLHKSITNSSARKHKINSSTYHGKIMKATSTFRYMNSETDNTSVDGNNASSYEVDESTLIDPQNVTSFIFKGEEYVQMSKEFFLKEKLALLLKIKQYEKVLKTIRRNVNELDFNEHS